MRAPKGTRVALGAKAARKRVLQRVGLPLRGCAGQGKRASHGEGNA
jgi:hypothetical protein